MLTTRCCSNQTIALCAADNDSSTLCPSKTTRCSEQLLVHMVHRLLCHPPISHVLRVASVASVASCTRHSSNIHPMAEGAPHSCTCQQAALLPASAIKQLPSWITPCRTILLSLLHHALIIPQPSPHTCANLEPANHVPTMCQPCANLQTRHTPRCPLPAADCSVAHLALSASGQ
jgi:hypothetical protein